jgi:hypothetical protein
MSATQATSSDFGSAVSRNPAASTRGTDACGADFADDLRHAFVHEREIPWEKATLGSIGGIIRAPALLQRIDKNSRLVL